MCGRVISKSQADALVAKFGVTNRRQGDIPDPLPKRYNGAPGLDYPLIVQERDMPGASFLMARWGFVPRWHKPEKGPPRRPVNAMSETVASNGMFRDAYRFRRALMPVDGYFEWKAIKGAKAKQPFVIALKDGRPFALAAIWESWRDEHGMEVRTFAVLTCPPNEMMAEIHDRMPVVLAPEDYREWLGEEPDPAHPLKPYPADDMVMWPVSTRVNSPKNNDPDIIVEVAETEPDLPGVDD